MAKKDKQVKEKNNYFKEMKKELKKWFGQHQNNYLIIL